MDITPFIPEDRFTLRGYGKGNFRVNDATYHSAILLTPVGLLPLESLNADDGFPSASRLSGEAQQMIQQHSVLLLGTGKTFPSDAGAIITDYVQAFGRSPDVMDTGAACRTFNVLAGEERDVCALLLPV